MSDPFDHYRRMLETRSPEELHSIAHVKRFSECYFGDSDFRTALAERPQQAGKLLHQRKIALDLDEVAPIWRTGPRFTLDPEEVDQCPKTALWSRWLRDLLVFRDLMRELGNGNASDRRFNAWRQRQIKRTISERGLASSAITHAILSYELTEGCKMGCWFCALNAGPFKEAIPYTKTNAELWRGILRSCRDFFGRAAGTGFCYWATEPMDNPDYLTFLLDYHEIIGVLPQTTTAAPLRDPEFTRAMLALYPDRVSVPPRFSVLSVKAMREIHEEFSPAELLTVELITQQKEGFIVKARSGRVRNFRSKTAQAPSGNLVCEDPGSIACLSGFLINMVKRTVKLISPCLSTNQWPLGYRIHSEARFDTVEDFRSFIEYTFRCHMPETVEPDAIARFRKDLDYVEIVDGFSLNNKHRQHSVTGKSYAQILGGLINKGAYSADRILSEFRGEPSRWLAARSTLQDLFQAGLLDDDPAAA